LCKSEYAYPSDHLLICPECFHVWDPSQINSEEAGLSIKDANGLILATGGSVLIIKDLPVKGMSKAIKAGTKVKNIRLNDKPDGHKFDCKIEGFGAMALKSEFVRKI
jgi:protein PhnA